MSNVLVITTSLRPNSNSDILTERLIAGAKDAGHQVEEISLKGKNLKFCIGCLACQQTQKCVLNDDAIEIAEKMKEADTLVFSTPSVAFEDEDYVPQKAESGLEGWVDCFENAEFMDSLFCGGLGGPGEASAKKEALDKAYEFGRSIE